MSSNLSYNLRNHPLSYRNTLTIPQNIKFGLELEIDKINPELVYKLVKKEFGEKWIIKEDRSLTRGENAEIIPPVFTNTKQTWILLKRLSILLEKLNPTYDNCSFQINFDEDFLPTQKDKIIFLKLYAMYEDIIYRFSQGEDHEYRDTIEIYAYPIINNLKTLLQYADDDFLLESFQNNKRYGLSFKNNPKKLIEFRSPNMTNNPILWQNYITFFYYLLDFASKKDYSLREIDKYIEEFNKAYLLDNYSLEKKEKAISLTKKIFPHKIDQIYFLHQYLENEN